MSSIEEQVMHLQIPIQDILVATNEFDNKNLVSNGGGFGKVYKGVSNKHGRIAIKRLDRGHGQGDHEFKTEIALLSVYKHENIVTLIGFCDEDDEKILVYKYESKGSLDKHLNNKDLTWIQRLQICLDAARGLAYLHDDVGSQHRILHRDVKSSNILLDENWKAKISDFGLSRIGPANMQSTFLISNPCGTPGYIDPDYCNTGYLTQKSDVYSFGIVLFEVLCGRLTRVTSYKDESQFLSVLAPKHYKRQTLCSIIPSYLRHQIHIDSLQTFSKIAYQCLKNGEERPTMKQVVEQLQTALHNQLAPTGSRPEAYRDSSEVIDFRFSGGNVTLITDIDAWDQKLLEAKTLGKIVIANFSASWCGVCRSISPDYISLSEKHPSLTFLTISADKLTINDDKIQNAGLNYLAKVHVCSLTKFEKKLEGGRSIFKKESKGAKGFLGRKWRGPNGSWDENREERSIFRRKTTKSIFLTRKTGALLKELSIEWNLKVTPTFIFLKDGKEIDKLEGANNSKLQKKITALDSQAHDQKPQNNSSYGFLLGAIVGRELLMQIIRHYLRL